MADSLDLLEDGGVLDFGSIIDPSDETIELNNQFALLNRLSYDISIAYELDGLYDELVISPELAVEKAGLNLWVTMTSGFFHRIRLSALEDGQMYHIRFLECTMHYQGQLS